MLSPKLMLYGGECSTKESWRLMCGRVSQHRDPGGCPFGSLPTATNPILSSHHSSQLCPPFTRALGEWLQTRSCALALLKDAWVSSRLCLSLADRNPTDFHSQMLCGHLFQALILQAGEPCMWLRPHALQGNVPAAEISF